jgi:hypothetical protein
MDVFCEIFESSVTLSIEQVVHIPIQAGSYGPGKSMISD